MRKKIVALPGDGIGPELMQSALHVLKAVSQNWNEYEVETLPFGGAAIDVGGDPFPKEVERACRDADAILLGAIGGPKWEQAIKTPEDGLLELRQTLGLYANIRPTKAHDHLLHLSPLKKDRVKNVDFVIVRELIGGLYFGRPRYVDQHQAIDTMHYTVEQIEQVVRTAFELAEGRREKLTSVDKANVLANSKLWRQIVDQLSFEYPKVEVEHLYVDAAAMKLVMNPSSFDVIVTENLFGDILSDEASVITGSLGMLPSASLGLNGPALYEPIHGSAPALAGKGLANPMSMILSVCLMLRQSFNQEEKAEMIEQQAYALISKGCATRDLGGTATTSQFSGQLAQRLAKGEEVHGKNFI